VTFEMSDVFLPGPEELLPAPGGVEGTVIGFSDSGTRSRVFAVVEVVSKWKLVVPVDKLQLISPTVDE